MPKTSNISAHASEPNPTPAAFAPRLRRADPAWKLHKLSVKNMLGGAQVLNLNGLEESVIFAGLPSPSISMTGSDLWTPLDAAYGKCDGMIPGKYHRARMFSFETDALLIWCASETGDRGTGWYFLDKARFDPKNPQPGRGYSFSRLDPNDPLSEKIASFARDLILDMAQAHAPTRADLKKLGAACWEPFLAMEAFEQAGEISTSVFKPKASRPRPRM